MTNGRHRQGEGKHGRFESKFDIYLNTENPAVVRRLIDVYPFAGVCCNPKMVARLNRTDFATIVKELRETTGGIRACRSCRPMWTSAPRR